MCIMQIKLGCITKLLLMIHFDIVKKLSDFSKALQRITVLCRLIMTADKRKLFVIGKRIKL